MNRNILTKQPMIDIPWLANHLRIEEDRELFENYCHQALSVAKPKAVYSLSFIDQRDQKTVTIDGNTFHCELMVKNFQDIHRVFPFAATCGREVYEWAQTITDVFERYWVDNMMEAILRDMISVIYQHIKKHHGIEKISSMNPGSLEGWPIQEQTKLFELIGGVKTDIGVELTDSYLMIPQKSVSGILFASNSQYSNCKLCQREHCPSRRDPFDVILHNQMHDED